MHGPSSRSRARTRVRGRVERRKRSPIIASNYCAVIEGRMYFGGDGRVMVHTIDDSDKRVAMREAKRYALANFVDGTTVTLRAGSPEGGILERVKLSEQSGAGPHRWLSDFET